MRCVPQVLDIKAKAKIMFRLTLSTNFEKRSVDIHIGDFIDGLIYQEDDSLREVSGVVKSINTFERALPRSSYDSPDFISLRNAIESITLDVSDKYNSELITIDIVNIRNYDMVIHNTLEIKHLDVVDKNHIRFYSETKPIAFVWNDKTFLIEADEIDPFVYNVTIDTMNMTNILTIFDDSGCIYKQVVNGPGMDVVDEHDVQDDLKSVIYNFQNLFFEKYNNTDLTDLIGDSVYIPLVKNIGDIESFIMNGITYYTDDLPYVEVLIPNRDTDVKVENAATMYPFKFIDDDFCICAPIIPHFVDENGILSMNVNGYEQSWLILPNRNVGIDIKDIIAMNVPNGYVPTVVTSTDYNGLDRITMTRTHMSTYPAIYYSSKRCNEVNRGIMCIAITEDNGWSYKYKLVKMDTLRNRQTKESIYIPEKFLENSPVYVNETREFGYHVFVFGEGFINFDITLIDRKK